MNHLISPELLERYEPLGVLGHGAFATVIKARSRRSGQFVAIKHFQHPSGQRHTFFREVQLTIQLQHPNIVRCVDLFSADENTSDLILEFADSGNLRTQIAPDQPLTLQQTIPIVLHMINGLVHAHHEGILHRDLKPENILIFAGQPEPIYKIADFGIAKYVGQAGKAMTNVGSPFYMAPEQFYDQYDLKTDIYALGIMFYELLHGDIPFQGSHAEIFKGHLEGAASISNHIPDDVRELLQAMLVKDPETRPDAHAVQSALEALVDAYDLCAPLPDLQEERRVTEPVLASQQSGEFMFADFFDDAQPEVDNPTQPPTGLEPPISAVPATTASSREPLPTPEDTVTSTMQDNNAESFFGDTFDEPDEPKPAPPVKPRPAAPIEAAPPLPSMQAEGMFDEGFDTAEPVQADMAFRLSGNLAETAIHIGRIQITPQWTRAVDTKSLYLANLYDDDTLLVVTQKGVHELNAQAGKGMVLYQGDVQAIGTASRGLLPILRDQEVILLEREQTEPHLWAMDAPVEQICFAPEAQGVAAVAQQTLYYHDHQGELLWSSELSQDTSEVYMAFENTGELAVTRCHPDDQGVYFYDRDGKLLAQHWLPGRIVSAARCHFDLGTWVVIANDTSTFILRIGREGTISRPRIIERPLRRLVGTASWVCGVDETDTLYVLDPSTGHMAPLPLQGELRDFSPGPDPGLLYILEGRSEVLRYTSVFAIERVADA